MVKNKHDLVLPLTGRLLDVIVRRWEQRAPTPWVFHQNGRQIGRVPDAVWKGAAKAVGRPGLLLHDLRRAGARTLIRAGVPREVVMRMGGWRTASMLSRYNIVDTADLVDAQAKMNEAFSAPRKVVPLRRAL